MKLLSIVITLALVTVAGPASAEKWYSPYCPSGSLQKNGLNAEWVCVKSVSEAPDCPSGATLEVDAIGKDKCVKVATSVKAVECKLMIGEIAANWAVVATSGPDHCEHKEQSKGQREVKCPAGHTLEVNGGSGNKDRCVDESTVTKSTASCPAGADHKVGGPDKCETETRTAPAFR